MTLRTRLSLFFLGSLAVVLMGFSTTLYVVSARYLHRQTDERLESILNTLAAAAEVTPEGVEWEPEERSLSFGRRMPEGLFSWTVANDRGERLDGNGQGYSNGSPRALDAQRPRTIIDSQGARWRVMRRVLRPETAGVKTTQAARAESHSALILEAAIGLEGVQAALRNLGLWLTGLSLGVWCLAFVGGRLLSRRALRPLTEMAGSAHAIRGDDVSMRLPELHTRDELEELGRSFNALLDRLQESFERQQRFTGDASHQLRTPLTVLQGQVDLALRQDRTTDEYRRVLSTVQRKTRHLRRIVESLLFLARADHESLSPTLETVNLSEQLGVHLRTLQERSPPADVHFESADSEPVLVKAQPVLLTEMIDNLIDNAIRHSPPGTAIRVRLGREGEQVALSIEDQGPGIAESDLPHLFEPFFQTAEARRQGAAGTGLGLSVVQRLARLFGATVEVESKLGAGARFTVRFPAVAPTELIGRSDGESATAFENAVGS